MADPGIPSPPPIGLWPWNIHRGAMGPVGPTRHTRGLHAAVIVAGILLVALNVSWGLFSFSNPVIALFLAIALGVITVVPAGILLNIPYLEDRRSKGDWVKAARRVAGLCLIVSAIVSTLAAFDLSAADLSPAPLKRIERLIWPAEDGLRPRKLVEQERDFWQRRCDRQYAEGCIKAWVRSAELRHIDRALHSEPATETADRLGVFCTLWLAVTALHAVTIALYVPVEGYYGQMLEHRGPGPSQAPAPSVEIELPKIIKDAVSSAFDSWQKARLEWSPEKQSTAKSLREDLEDWCRKNGQVFAWRTPESFGKAFEPLLTLNNIKPRPSNGDTYYDGVGLK